MKVAIVKLSALGDIVHAMVALQFIKVADPSIEIDWIVEEGFAGVLENNPDINQILTPQLFDYSSHVFHQYTIQVDAGIRNELKAFLAQKGIPTMIYYPLPLHKQKAFADCVFSRVSLEVSDSLCGSVLSLPMHTEMHIEEQDYIVSSVGEFFNFK